MASGAVRSRSAPHPAAWVVSVLGLIVAAFLIPGGVVGIINGVSSTATAKGTITSVGKNCHGSFVDQGGAVHAFTHYGDKLPCADEFHVGQIVTVHYDPDHPHFADTESPTFTVISHAVLLAVGLAFALPLWLSVRTDVATRRKVRRAALRR
jgi:hypothetical protein